MSVLIKGFEMPKECRDCPLEMYYMNSGETRCRAENKILAENFKAIPFDGRPDFCPLVEVPAHGRLIDADALDKRVRQAGGTADAEVNCTEDFNDGILFVLDYFVKSMQTVIEAEGTE